MITPSKEFWEIFKNTNGALSCTEAVAIMNIAAQIPAHSIFLELGTYHGKSAMSAAIGLKYGAFNLVDPLFEDKELAKKVQFIVANIQPGLLFCPTDSRISTDALLDYKELAYVFVDSGSHQYGLPMQEVKLLEDRMMQGGIIAFHDWNSQFREVKEASDYLVSTGKYEYIPINWNEIIQYVNENNLEDGNLSWHHNELKNPCFVGAVKRK